MIKFGEPATVHCHCGGGVEIIAPPEVTYKSKSIPQIAPYSRKELKFRFPAVCELQGCPLWVEVTEFHDKLTITVSSREEIVQGVLSKNWPKALEAEAIKSALEWEEK